MLASALALVTAASAEELSFSTADGGTVVADAYGERGRDAVVLAPGAVFDKGSWRPQAERLAAGRRVLAIDFRGHGRSRAGSEPDALYQDVLAAVRHLRAEGSKRVAVVGGSLGAAAAARAAIAAPPGEIDRLVLLAPAAFEGADRLRIRTLFVVSVDEPSAARVHALYERTSGPKRLLELPGAAHAQHVFATEQGERLVAAILDFVAEP